MGLKLYQKRDDTPIKIIETGKSKQIQLRILPGNAGDFLLDVRVWRAADNSEFHPCKAGIMLTIENWKKLSANIAETLKTL